jgi:hypothetical protein
MLLDSGKMCLHIAGSYAQKNLPVLCLLNRKGKLVSLVLVTITSATTFLSAKHPSLQKRLRPIIRQRNTHQRPRLDSPIRTRVRKTTKHKLVYGEVQIPIFSSGKLYQCQHNTHPPTQGYRLKLTVSIQFNLGSLTNVLTVPFAGLKIDTAFCSIFPW